MSTVSDYSLANQGFSAFRTELNNILGAIDNPKTINDIVDTASSARTLTKKMSILTKNSTSVKPLLYISFFILYEI